MLEDVRVFFPLFSLALVFVSVVFVYVFLKGKKLYLNKNTRFKEISRYHYSPKNYISMLELDDKILLLGITENNITFLGELDNLEIKKNGKSDFTELLNNKIESDMMNGIKSRLKQMRENNNDEENR